MHLHACPCCDGLIPTGRPSCPHCDGPARQPRTPLGRLWRGACAGGAMMTLMACYGMIARPVGPNQGYDRDGDGVGDATDCDDTRTDVYPGAADLDGDGVDQNCDGVDGWRDPDAPVAPAITTEPAAPPTPPPAIATDPPVTPAPPRPPAAIAVDPP